MPNKHPLSDQDKQDIIKFYLAGNSTHVTAREMKISRITLSKILDSNGIRKRDHSESKIKYKIDESYFEKIDTPEKAQVLGFFAADGCIYKRKRSAKEEKLSVIGISVVDLKYLEWIAEQWKTDTPILFSSEFKKYEGNRTQSIKLGTYNGKIYDDLEKLGMTQRKSLTLKFPNEDQLPRKFWRDFIRGYFEGDGGICVNKNRPNVINVNFAGTPEFNEKLKEIIEMETGIKGGIYGDERPRINFCYFVACGPKNSLRLLEWMFKDCSYKMERKWQSYLKFRAKFDENLDFIVTPEREAETSKRRSEAFRNRTPETQQRCVDAIKSAHRHLYLKFHIKSPTGQIYQCGAAKPFCKEFGLSLFAIRLVAKEGKETAALRGWAIPTPEEIATAQTAGLIIEKIY